ncbi:MAG: glutamate synthase (NADPH/NADH) small chain [Candidatus Saganbacteria bacterium]|uniref:Glutamate synthase (NADPH/NADH) small chain n=1 Tax=Candidatus Saganbacteria bacterium TaxID=2575572 RepID=A0A833L2C6_UNCSA|nr:MAG: glutamate synthase (NADPH/NADH) small chain [Candidatus Saganbacteria bacterium]
MGNPKGFIKYSRKKTEYRPSCERIKDYDLVFKHRAEADSKEQASRCMDCGTPFCHWGCPLANYIPEWNDYNSFGFWKKAYQLLSQTNNLPEITGRVCPALCEFACVLGINDDPVTIRENELSIIEYAFKKEWVRPNPPKIRTGKKVAIIGSGPAGISCAAQLNQKGHTAVVFEKDKKIGGLMRYGIPDFKLEKSILDRRIEILKEEGIIFKTGINVDIQSGKILEEYDAVCYAGGCRTPRDLKVKGRELDGIHFALEYLSQTNKIISGEQIKNEIEVCGKKVVVIGGGDTGSDCVGTANRQGVASVVQLELLPKPPEKRLESQPWPKYPNLLKNTSSHEEGCGRKWSVMTKEFIGKGTNISGLRCVLVDCDLKEIPGSEFAIEADVVLLALGFLSPEKMGFTSENVFVAGDARRGQSLIVWAIQEGRSAAAAIDAFLLRT